MSWTRGPRRECGGGLFELGIEAPDVGQELSGELETDVLDRGQGLDLSEERLGVRSVEFPGHSARCEPGERGVKPADHWGAMAADVEVALGVNERRLRFGGRPASPWRTIESATVFTDTFEPASTRSSHTRGLP
jgi:hypothetical protein